MHQIYVYKLWYSKNRNSWEENFLEKESWKEEEPQLNQSLRATGRWLATPTKRAWRWSLVLV
jgi:hypothetical protein